MTRTKVKPTVLKLVHDGKYKILQSNRDGKVYCTCLSWKFSTGFKSCKHLEEYEAEYAAMQAA